MTTDFGAPASGTGSREPDPQAVPALTGFDPSRFGSWACGKLMSIPEAGAVNHAMYDRWVARTESVPPLARNDSGWADLAAIAMLCLHHYRDSDGSPQGRDAQQLDGEAATARAEGIAQDAGQ